MRSSTSKNSSKTKKLTSRHYEELGRIVASVYESGYLDAAKSYKMAFFKGIVTGLGSVIGATLLFALLLWVLSFFDRLPLIDTVVDTIENSQQP
jgi:hypothetical protein